MTDESVHTTLKDRMMSHTLSYYMIYMLLLSICIAVIQLYRYLPLDWASKKELTVDEVRKLNQHNVDLVKGLHQHTNLYTSYQHGNFTCIALKSVSCCVL